MRFCSDHRRTSLFIDFKIDIQYDYPFKDTVSRRHSFVYNAKGALQLRDHDLIIFFTAGSDVKTDEEHFLIDAHYAPSLSVK